MNDNRDPGHAQPHDANKAASNAASEEALKRAEEGSVPAGPEDEYINDDERKRFNYKSRYPAKVMCRIRIEAAYVCIVLLLSLLGIFLTWRGEIFNWATIGCSSCQPVKFDRYSYLFFSGLLGGSLFGLKYLYKVTARGWWNEDREIWRIFSPWLSAGLAFATGALASAGLFGFDVNHHQGGASFVSLGFIAGYFADSASRKMQEVADILFGHPHPHSKKPQGTDQHKQGK